MDEPCTLDESANLPWHPRTKTGYGCKLRTLVSYAAQTSPSTVAQAPASILAEGARMGRLRPPTEALPRPCVRLRTCNESS